MKKLLSLVKLALKFTLDLVCTLVIIPLEVVGALILGIYGVITNRDIMEIPCAFVDVWKVAINGVKDGLENYKGDLLSILES